MTIREKHFAYLVGQISGSTTRVSRRMRDRSIVTPRDREIMPSRHCERSEAILRGIKEEGIASLRSQ
jgi:hypothetical protein